LVSGKQDTTLSTEQLAILEEELLRL
jgi:hypothetical protein